MGLRDEILAYVDGNGLVAPRRVSPGEIQASDNGPMFTSEYMLQLVNAGEFEPSDYTEFLRVIVPCLTYYADHKAVLLNRAPQDTSQDSIDDYLGVTAACRGAGEFFVPRGFLRALWRGKGWMNNSIPGRKTQEAFMLRFPQLVAAFVSAAYPGKSLRHRAVRLAAFPLYAYAALVIFLACRRVPKGQADPWRLTWLLGQAVNRDSLLCRLAYRGWYKRLARAFPSNPQGSHMQEVAKVYYEAGHPFQRYFLD